MIRRVVYDTMVFFQWVILPEGRLHGTARAVMEGAVCLCISRDLMAEVEDLLTRPAIRAKWNSLTPDHVEQFLGQIVQHAEVISPVPSAFHWAEHPDDDHLFNLAIAARADALVTWEKRILHLASAQTAAARSLRRLAPEVKILNPKAFSQAIADPGH